MTRAKRVVRRLAAGILLVLASLGWAWADAPGAGGVGVVLLADQATPTVEIIVGELEKTSRGLVLHAQDGDFRLKGLDMSQHQGRQVEVTGVISEEEQALPLIMVQRYKVLR